MTKIIKIENCNMCPRKDYNPFTGYYYCPNIDDPSTAKALGNIFDNATFLLNIDPDCPLEDFKESGRVG